MPRRFGGDKTDRASEPSDCGWHGGGSESEKAAWSCACLGRGVTGGTVRRATRRESHLTTSGDINPDPAKDF